MDIEGLKANVKEGSLEVRENVPAPNLDVRRRQFVRGAAAAGPLVLTLRSGAVAAAVSCVGTKALNVSVDANGNFTIPSVVELQPGDKCAEVIQTCADPNQTEKIAAANVDISEINSLSSTQAQCGNARSTTVAILSSSSATSLA